MHGERFAWWKAKKKSVEPADRAFMIAVDRKCPFLADYNSFDLGYHVN